MSGCYGLTLKKSIKSRQAVEQQFEISIDYQEGRQAVIKYIFGIFTILHGLVYLVYVGQSQRIFELRPGMLWPDESWLFSKLFNVQVIRWLASITFVMVAAAFVTGGFGFIFEQDWSLPTLLWVSVLASLMTILFWDGKFRKLDDQGGLGILLNLVIIVLVLILD
jgi:uncharacterized membrane protein YkvI